LRGLLYAGSGNHTHRGEKSNLSTDTKYINNPPEGMTARDIRNMSEDELLDMDYYLNDDNLDDDFEEGGFSLF